MYDTVKHLLKHSNQSFVIYIILLILSLNNVNYDYYCIHRLISNSHF